ncbi:MAG: dTDP-glucose 4,6-dehydratase [Acidimicrobiia bacterium]
MRLLITGGSGFIGSAVVRMAVAQGHSVVNVDKLTYAATEGSTASVEESANYDSEIADIVDTQAMAAVFSKHQPDAVIHLAAESHVDRSIDRPAEFVTTNVVGTVSLLIAANQYHQALSGRRQAEFRFVHVSTDEVFGSLDESGVFDLQSPYDPRSPYSASKAGADHAVRAWHHTYGLPTIISNGTNNYGPFQFPEKLVPMMIIRGLAGTPLPVFGDGNQVRDWLYVEDHADALLRIAEVGEAGSTYLIGAHEEHRNLDIVRRICSILDDLEPADDGMPREHLITFVEDRPGHDFRYALDSTDTAGRLGWSASTTLDVGLHDTAEWYLENRSWWTPLASKEAIGRAGLGAVSGGAL